MGFEPVLLDDEGLTEEWQQHAARMWSRRGHLTAYGVRYRKDCRRWLRRIRLRAFAHCGKYVLVAAALLSGLVWFADIYFPGTWFPFVLGASGLVLLGGFIVSLGIAASLGREYAGYVWASDEAAREWAMGRAPSFGQKLADWAVEMAAWVGLDMLLGDDSAE